MRCEEEKCDSCRDWTLLWPQDTVNALSLAASVFFWGGGILVFSFLDKLHVSYVRVLEATSGTGIGALFK